MPKYRFRKVKLPNWNEGMWFFCPQHITDVLDHFNIIIKREITAATQEYVRDAVVTPSGAVLHPHPDTPFGVGVTVLADTFKIPWAEAAVKLENQTLQDRLNAYRDSKYIHIYLGDGITWFTEHNGMEIEILEEVFLDELVYPVKKIFDYSDVRYMKWDIPGLSIKGTHWYAKVGNMDVIDKNGKMKWDTEAEALRAAEWFVDNYNRKSSIPRYIHGVPYPQK